MADLTIEDLNPDDILQAELFLTAFIKEQFPSMDLAEGRVLRELLIRPAAIIHTLEKTDLDRLRLSMSINAIEKDPTLADDEQVDAVLSNFRITRSLGAKSIGQITIVINRKLTTSVPAGTIFTLNALEFITKKSFVGVTTEEAAIIDPATQRQIFPRNDGKFSFVVDVEATTAGEISKVRRNTTFDSVTPEPSGLAVSFATQDFSGGSSEETNAELVARFKLALSPTVYSGRTHIESLFRETVPDIKSVSIIGLGDEEMLRDRHNIFATSQGGKADIYVRTSSFPESVKLSKTATLIDASTKKWQITILKDDAPGFYLVETILSEGTVETSSSLEITSEVRQLNLVPDNNEFIPDIDTNTEGVYSNYQTAIVQFLDPESVVTDVDPLYDVYVQALPKIGLLQDKSSDRSSRNPSADYLVKAPVPAYVTLSVKIQHTELTNAPSPDEVKKSIVDAINDLNFSMGRLPISIIHDSIHNVTGSKNVLVAQPSLMYCRIRKPDGTFINLNSADIITIPELPEEGITSRTTVFYISVNDIDLTIEQISALPV